MHLIVGGDSVIGKALGNYWEKNNIDFHKYENFHLLINKMRMYKVFKLLYDGKRLEAITISQELGIKFRLKTIVAAMLPRFVLRRYIYF